MEILKETLPTNPFPLLAMAIATITIMVSLWICAFVYKESYKSYMTGVGYSALLVFIFFLLFILISSTSHYTYQVLITDDNMFKELAIRGYTVGEMYPGLGQKLYQIAGPIIDWLQ